MQGRTSRCSGSLSRGDALTRIVIVVVAAVVLFFAVRMLFPSREERLHKFIEHGRDALAAGREEDFLAAFDPGVRYQTNGGIEEIRRDWKRYRESGVGETNVLRQQATLDATGADVHLEVVFAAGLQPIGKAAVTMRLEDGGGDWHVTALAWK